MTYYYSRVKAVTLCITKKKVRTRLGRPAYLPYCVRVGWRVLWVFSLLACSKLLQYFISTVDKKRPVSLTHRYYSSASPDTRNLPTTISVWRRKFDQRRIFKARCAIDGTWYQRELPCYYISAKADSLKINWIRSTLWFMVPGTRKCQYEGCANTNIREECENDCVGVGVSYSWRLSVHWFCGFVPNFRRATSE